MNAWLQWCYNYGVGGAAFLATVVVALRMRAIRIDHLPERQLLMALTAGIVLFAAVHAVWIAIAQGG